MDDSADLITTRSVATPEVPSVDGYEHLVLLGEDPDVQRYRARQLAFGRTVLLDVFATRAVSEAVRARFDRAWRIAANLSWHPRIVVVYDGGRTADGRAYLATEDLPNGSLADRVRANGPRAWDELAAAGADVAGALACAHAAGAVHGALTPAHLMIHTLGYVKLAGFESVVLLGRETARVATLLWVARYAAPEVLAGAPPNAAADVYALASVLASVLDPASDPPPTLLDLLSSTRAADPAHRPTAEALVEGLGAVRRGHEPATGAIAPPPTPVHEAVVPAPAHATPRRRRRHSIAVAGAGAVGAALIAAMLAGGVIAGRDGGRDDEGGRIRGPAAVVDHVWLDTAPDSLAVSRGSAWASTYLGVVRVDLGTGLVSEVDPGLSTPAVVAADADGVWVGERYDDPLARLDPATGEVLDRATGVRFRFATASGPDGTLWESFGSEVSRVVPGDRQPQPVARAASALDNLAAGPNDLWAVADEEGVLVRIAVDGSHPVQQDERPVRPTAVAVGFDSVWVTSTGEDALLRIDPDTNRVRARVVFAEGALSASDGGWLATGAGSVWLLVDEDGRRLLARIDPSTNRVTQRLDVGTEPRIVAADDRAVWVAGGDVTTGYLVRVGEAPQRSGA